MDVQHNMSYSFTRSIKTSQQGCGWCVYYWVNIIKPHTGTFNVEFYLYGMYVRLYVMAGTAGSAGHSYRHSYCHHVFCLHVHSETTLERGRQMERERTAIETWDESGATLCHMWINCYLAHARPYLSTVPQCPGFWALPHGRGYSPRLSWILCLVAYLTLNTLSIKSRSF